jgi:hypothetical protein
VIGPALASRAAANVPSLTFPGVSRSTRGRPCSSVRAWILVVRPPRERPIAWTKSPFCARRRAVGLDMGSVDRRGPVDPARSGQRLEDREPHALKAPAVVAVIDRGVGAIGRRTVPPARACPQHVDDAADHSPVVDPSRPATATRQQRFDLRPLPVVQPVKVLPHQGLHHLDALNHNSQPAGILIEYGP